MYKPVQHESKRKPGGLFSHACRRGLMYTISLNFFSLKCSFLLLQVVGNVVNGPSPYTPPIHEKQVCGDNIDDCTYIQMRDRRAARQLCCPSIFGRQWLKNLIWSDSIFWHQYICGLLPNWFDLITVNYSL